MHRLANKLRKIADEMLKLAEVLDAPYAGKGRKPPKDFLQDPRVLSFIGWYETLVQRHGLAPCVDYKPFAKRIFNVARTDLWEDHRDAIVEGIKKLIATYGECRLDIAKLTDMATLVRVAGWGKQGQGSGGWERET